MNLLLVDSTIPSLNTFLDGVNQNTKTVTYSIEDTFESLKEKIDNLGILNFDYMGFVFQDKHYFFQKFISDNSFITLQNNNINIIEENNTTLLIKELVRKYSIKTLDFLACNLLNYPEWKNYFDYLMKENEGLLVRASNDKTGNLNAGGNWILESTNQDVSNLYFNENIGIWNELLDWGSHFAILKNDGTLWVKGNNNKGQLGLGHKNNVTDFTQVPNLTNVISFSTGYEHTSIIKSDGTVWCCGNNDSGQLGNFNYSLNGFSIIPETPLTESTTFVQGYYYSDTSNNPTVINNAKIISCGAYTTTIITTEGHVYTTGSNQSFQLGLNKTLSDPLYKFRVYQFIREATNIDNAIAVSCNSFASIGIIKSDGSVWFAGYNSYNQCGGGGGLVFTRESTNINNAISIGCGLQYTIIIKSDKTVWGTGEKFSCGLGDTGGSVSVFTRELTNIDNAIDVAAGQSDAIILKSDGTVVTSKAYYGGTFNRNLTVNGNNIDSVNSVWSNYTSYGAIKLDNTVWTSRDFNANDTTILSNTNITNGTYYKSRVKKNITGPTFNNLNVPTNVSITFPNPITNTITNTDVPLGNASSTPFANISNLQKIIYLEPAGTIFSDYISFDITVNDTTLTVIDFFSSNDTAPVRLGTNPNNTYGAYYEIINATTVRIYTKHFSGASASSNGGCLLKGTSVLTSDGYKLIETLNNDDIIITDDNRYLPIKRIQKLIINPNKHPDLIPYKINKNSIEENYPSEDTYVSGYHMIKYGNNWIQPNKCPKFKKDKNVKEIVYYHIELENFETDNLIVNGGLIVESLVNGTISDSKIWIERSKYSLIIE